LKETRLRRLSHILLTALLALLIMLLCAWSVLALWYRLPLPEWGRGLAAAALGIVGICTVAALVQGRWLLSTLAFAVPFVAVVAWWSTITPPAVADWSPDVARQVTGKVAGDGLTLDGVRNFDWRSDTDFTERWETRDYDLRKLESVDLFMSYWSGPLMAHMMLSFGFEDGNHLVWSMEVRRRRGGEFSPIADLFKSNPLVIVAAEERDVIGVRSNVRGEDVQLYRMKVPAQVARGLLLAYVDDANRLANQPRWYNSITTNCTTAVVAMMRASGDVIPFDWRLYVNGYVPDYLYDRGALDTNVGMSELRQRSHIDDRAKRAGLTPQFSETIRDDMPSADVTK
jgi:hypothetical protein